MSNPISRLLQGDESFCKCQSPKTFTRKAAAIRLRHLLLFWIGLCFVLPGVGAKLVAEEKAAVFQFSIPCGIASETLRTAAEQADIDLLFRMDLVETVSTPSLDGKFSIEEAFAILLENSKLRIWYDPLSQSYAIMEIEDGSYRDVRETEPVKPKTNETNDMNKSKSRLRKFFSALVGLVVAASPSASGQITDNEDIYELEAFEVISTGTSLRGIDPVGTQVVGMWESDIIETGSMDTNQLLSQIPLITSAFNKVPVLPSTDSGNSIIRPQLRNFTSGSGSSNTLVLIDGHRAVNAGVTITSPDPGVLPPSIIERIDVVPDGGSAIYGSDAVAGVINFITKSRFDGTQIDARYGFADNYYEADVNVTMGKTWKDGGAYIAVSHSEHEALMGRDLDWFHLTTPPTGHSLPGTIVLNDGTTHALPGKTPGTLSQTDALDGYSVIPAEVRDSVFAVFNQDLSDSVTFDVRAFYSKRTNDMYIDSANGAWGEEVITSANPFFDPIGNETEHTVRYSYGDLLGINYLEEYGITAKLTAELGDNWQVRTLLNWGESENYMESLSIDDAKEKAAIVATTTDTAINPYDLSLTNASVLDSIFYSNRSRGRQTMNNVRVILDGSLYKIPGGNVSVAVGGEYTKEESDFLITTSPTDTTVMTPERDITAYFAEIAIPLVGEDNAVSGIDSLVLSAAIRTDDYSGVGKTTNSKLGISYNPVESVTFRASWGESFIAPSIADTVGAPDTRAILFANPAFPGADVNDAGLPEANLPLIFLAGGNADLKPQEATTWSMGVDVEVQSVEGLSLSATYYSIETENEVSNLFAGVFIPLGTQALYDSIYSNWIIKNPSIDFAKDYVSSISAYVNAGGGTSVDEIYAVGDGEVYAIMDFRRNNLSLTQQNGVDFNANYSRETDFGSITANIGGSYLLKRDVAVAPGAGLVDAMESPGMNRLTLAASLGATFDNVFVSTTFRHNGGYDISPSVSGQTSVDAYTTIDIFASYDFKGEGFSEGLSLTALLGNVLDTNPPTYRAGQGYANGSTKGRLIQIGLRKKF